MHDQMHLHNFNDIDFICFVILELTVRHRNDSILAFHLICTYLGVVE